MYLTNVCPANAGHALNPFKQKPIMNKHRIKVLFAGLAGLFSSATKLYATQSNNDFYQPEHDKHYMWVLQNSENADRFLVVEKKKETNNKFETYLRYKKSNVEKATTWEENSTGSYHHAFCIEHTKQDKGCRILIGEDETLILKYDAKSEKFTIIDNEYEETPDTTFYFKQISPDYAEKEGLKLSLLKDLHSSPSMVVLIGQNKEVIPISKLVGGDLYGPSPIVGTGFILFPVRNDKTNLSVLDVGLKDEDSKPRTFENLKSAPAVKGNNKNEREKYFNRLLNSLSKQASFDTKMIIVHDVKGEENLLKEKEIVIQQQKNKIKEKNELIERQQQTIKEQAETIDSLQHQAQEEDNCMKTCVVL